MEDVGTGFTEGVLEELQGYLLLAICFDLIQFEQHRRQRVIFAIFSAALAKGAPREG